jgi:hypothetical protein
LRRNAVRIVGRLAVRRNLRGNTLLNSQLRFISRVFPGSLGDVFASMLVALAKVALGNGDLAVRTVTELDPSVSARKVRADELLTMLDILRDNKVGRLKRIERKSWAGLDTY